MTPNTSTRWPVPTRRSSNTKLAQLWRRWRGRALVPQNKRKALWRTPAASRRTTVAHTVTESPSPNSVQHLRPKFDARSGWVRVLGAKTERSQRAGNAARGSRGGRDALQATTERSRHGFLDQSASARILAQDVVRFLVSEDHGAGGSAAFLDPLPDRVVNVRSSGIRDVRGRTTAPSSYRTSPLTLTLVTKALFCAL